MYATIDDAEDAVERLRIRHCADPEIARGMVAIWAGYRSWTDLERRVGTPRAMGPRRTDGSSNVDYPGQLRAYMGANGDPLLDGFSWRIMPAQLNQLLEPEEHPLADEATRDRVMAAAQSVLDASPRAPSWLELREVRTRPDGGFAIRVVTRHRDGVRQAHFDLEMQAYLDPDVADARGPSDGTDPEAVAGDMARRYVVENVEDAGEPPVPAVEVFEGRADHRYGVDLPTLRWAVERWGDETRDRLREHVIRRLGGRDGRPDQDMFAFADLDEPEPGEEPYLPRIERYTVHLVDGVLRRAMRLGPGVVWDRALHVTTSIPQTTAMALPGMAVEAVVEHPYLTGGIVKGVHEGAEGAVVELEERLVALDSAGPDEAAWRPFAPLPPPVGESGTAMVDWDIHMAPEMPGRVLDSAAVRGVYYALCDVRGAAEIMIVTGSGKLMSEHDGPFARDCPARILDAAEPTRDAGAVNWRLRCRGLTDRTDGSTVHF